jgi:hypothetical protein
VIVSYQPMTMAGLAGHLSRETDDKVRWKYVWEFLEEYRWESADRQPPLLAGEPTPTGEPKWDVLLAERFFPNEPLPARSRAMLEDLFDSA